MNAGNAGESGVAADATHAAPVGGRHRAANVAEDLATAEVRDVARQLAHAVDRARTARGDHDREAVWDLLYEVAHLPGPAVEVAATEITCADPLRRSIAADLLGVVADCHAPYASRATTVLLDAHRSEAHLGVHRSLARALGHGDRRAIPILVGYATHPDTEIRLAAARSLPSAMYDAPDDAGVAALLRLSGDVDPEVRNWATFGFGWQLPVDSGEIRDALWARTADPYPEARQEGIRGLARRRDARVVPLVAALLMDDDAHLSTFDAAAFLGDPALLPALAMYNPADQGVAEAMTECDPAARAVRDARAWELFETVGRRFPELPVALYCERYELGIFLDIAPIERPSGTPVPVAVAMGGCRVDELLARAGGDVDRAADLVAVDLLDAAWES